MVWRSMPPSRAVARSKPRLGPASRAARQLGATPTRSRLGMTPLTSPATGVGLLAGSTGEAYGLPAEAKAIRRRRCGFGVGVRVTGCELVLVGAGHGGE